MRDLLHGVASVSGSELSVDFTASEGPVAAGAARADFQRAFRATMHDILIKYAHDLALEALDGGLGQDAVRAALSGPETAPEARDASAGGPEPEQSAA